jgi:glycosyltransferase involved in cell wall biosynthesis
LKRKHVLVLADRYDSNGGLDVVVRETSQLLAKSHGFDVTVLASRVTRDVPLQEDHGDLRVLRYEGRPFASPLLALSPRIRALLAQRPVEIVHSHFAYASTGIAAIVPRTVPRIRTFHGSWALEGWASEVAGGQPTMKARIKRRLREEVEAWDLRCSRRIIVLSDFARNYLTGIFGIDPRKVVRIPGGVDIERFRPVADKVAERTRLSLPTEKRLLLFVGRLIPLKRIDVLIDAFARIRASYPNLHLAIVGDGPMLAQLRLQVQALELAGDVTFAGSQGNELSSYFAAADACILPSTETFGLVTLEALACGVPVIGSREGATIEILRGLDERLLVKGVEADQLAEAIRSFLSGDWSLALRPERLRAYVADNFTWGRHAELLAAELRALTGDPPAYDDVSAVT